MNKFYIIAPVVLLGAFVVFYKGALNEMAQKDELKQRAVAEAKVAADSRRAEMERKASEDAQRRQAEREAEERAKEEKRTRQYEDDLRQLREETDRYLAEAAAFQKEINALELKLGELRTLKEKMNQETFELAKQVELAKISRRNAELEIQRMVDMVAQRLGASSLAQMPPPAAPKK